MKKTKKGGARGRSKSATRRKRTKSPPKLRRTKSVRSKPSGVFTRYVNRNGEIRQIPKGPPNCTKNHSDIKKGDCFIDPINLDCLRKDEVVQNPTDNKKCFNRNEICRWLRTKPPGVNDDPETRKNFPAGWQEENCNTGSVENSHRRLGDVLNYLRVDILGNEVVSQYLINAQRLIDQNGALVSHLRPTPPRIPLEELLLIADSLVSSQLLDDNTYDDLLLLLFGILSQIISNPEFIDEWPLDGYDFGKLQELLQLSQQIEDIDPNLILDLEHLVYNVLQPEIFRDPYTSDEYYSDY